MCGITGVLALTAAGQPYLKKIDKAVETLGKRGPDANGVYTANNLALGHTRLSIIDISNASSQPFTDASGRYTIVLNGEFYNYKEHKSQLEAKGVRFTSEGDTEVLLQLFIQEGSACLEKINGFFAFAVYDKVEDVLFIARDRFGVKPLLYFQDEDKFIFASEMKAMMAYDFPKKIDASSLLMYLQLNYIPAPHSIFEDVKKVLPGCYVTLSKNRITHTRYYSIPEKEFNPVLPYSKALVKLKGLMEESVGIRMGSDVPIGAFLSGGIDSSVVVGLASGYMKDLKTFSIGFRDEPLFDETYYAAIVAKKFKTNHTVFSLSNDDLYSCLHDVLEYSDEPFADSSALAVFILSRETSKHVKVALAGDGADEMFAGYNKHQAAYAVQKGSWGQCLLKHSLPLWNYFPGSRNSHMGNFIRKIKKFSSGLTVSEKDRYWLWAGLCTEDGAQNLIKNSGETIFEEYIKRKEVLLEHLGDQPDMNKFLHSDMDLVLQNDMLTKVDMMSMANGLEVREPFLDYRLVDFAFSLPASYKIDGSMRKKVLKDAFKTMLPEE